MYSILLYSECIRTSRHSIGRIHRVHVNDRHTTHLDAQDKYGAVLPAREDEVVVGGDHQTRHGARVHGEFEAWRHFLRQGPVVHAHSGGGEWLWGGGGGGGRKWKLFSV